MSEPQVFEIKLTKKQIEQIVAEQKRAMERIVPLFIVENKRGKKENLVIPFPLMVRIFNLAKQAEVETLFAEQNVPNPANAKWYIA